MADKNNSKVYNFNSMRPAIIIAHNNGNKKAITKDLVDGAGIDNAYFIQWQTDVEALRKVVADYVVAWKNARFDSNIKASDVTSLKGKIYPKWKEILHVGEEDKTSRELHVDESDIVNLIGFVWDFMATENGTVESIITPQIFRKKVESLLGCAIAKNMILSNADRETLETYHKAQSRVQKAIDTLADLEEQKKSWEMMAKDSKLASEENFLKFINLKIKEIDEQHKATNEAKVKAEKDVAEVETKAKEILSRIKKAK